MTGHSYKVSDTGIDDILEEWKLFYPRRFALDPSPNLPAAIEVLLGGVRVRYPSQVRSVECDEESLMHKSDPLNVFFRCSTVCVCVSW